MSVEGVECMTSIINEAVRRSPAVLVDELRRLERKE